MILYEFICQDCQEQFEDLVSSIEQEILCPKCKSKNVKRLLSAVKNMASNTATGTERAAACAPGAGFS